jgi:DNA-directed RNA polymerase subunit RPC12/RpoP
VVRRYDKTKFVCIRCKDEVWIDYGQLQPQKCPHCGGRMEVASLVKEEPDKK